MINKQFDAINKNDIDILVSNGVPESKTIEYKEQLPGGSDGDKKEFLADVSSFANASGGDILYGVSAPSGLPTAANGLSGINNDAGIRRLEGIIQTSLAPRIPGLQIKAIDGFINGSIIMIRIPKSWNSPHMIIFKSSSRFFARNSAGKYQLDVDEIRSAFIASETLTERIREFRSDRIAKIIADETPVAIDSGAKMVLHLVPLSSFTSRTIVDIKSVQQGSIKLSPICARGWNDRYNFDGYMSYSRSSNNSSISSSYIQLFRNGIIEAVNISLIKEDDYGRNIPGIAFEEELIRSVDEYLSAQINLGLMPPIVIILSLLKVKGYKMGVGQRYHDSGQVIDRDLLLMPEIIVEEYGPKASDILRPIFDSVWQACGWERSLNYEDNGNWTGRKL